MALAAVLASGLAPVLVPGPISADERPDAFSRSSLAGSEPGVTMQQETVGARVARVRVVPGSGGTEVWALGISSARLERWGPASGRGQAVWLRYRPAAGWVLVGPPQDEQGRPVNPVLSAFDLLPSGEGWAVGEGGSLLHKSAGSTRWVVDRQLEAAAAEVTLTAVSLTTTGGRAVGFAVGTGAAVYRLEDGRWRPDDPGPDMVADGRPELAAVSAASAEEAWAVSGSAVERLIVYRRGPAGWRRVETGQVIFDRPPAKASGGGFNQAASGSAVAADASGAWIGGEMFPTSAAHPFGDTSPGAASRPFVLRYDASRNRFTSYCSDQYAMRQSGSLAGFDQSRLCDRPFPTSLFDISSFSVVPGGVFAGGFGLYRFDGRGWFREPDSNGYLVSVSMASGSEGWVASSGSSFRSGGTIRSTATTLGHWTARPRRAAVARWPQAQSTPLESVAVAADGSGRAIAVGQEGTGVLYYRGAGWDVVNQLVVTALHAAAWPAGGDPWAVGEGGVILRYDGQKWVNDPASTALTEQSLFATAFRSSSDGVAVGLGGTILRYDGERWRRDPDSGKATRKDLLAVAVTRDGYVAVGREAVLLERGAAGGWVSRRDVASRAARPGEPLPAFYAVATLPDGRVLVGGSQSTLLAGEPGGAYGRYAPPLEGTVVALAAGGSPGDPTIVASLTPDATKYRAERPSLVRGSLMVGDGRTWRDGSLDRRITMFPSTDSSGFQDPIYSIALEPGGRAGWGVGGTPAYTRDVEGHLRSETTSSVYRIAPEGDPRSPDVRAEVRFEHPGVSFAVFGESWCGRGLCSATAGTGTMADEVALRIREEINEASRLPGGPRFVVFTGNMRRQGLPEELGQFKRFLEGFRLPVFGAIGSTDLVPALTDSTTGAIDVTGLASRATNEFWMRTFARRPAPWGSGSPLPAFRPVTLATGEPVPGLARTHYAFDYLEGGKPRLRVVVVDSSTRSYGSPAEQNPREAQGRWLQAVLGEAQLRNIPRVVLMNQPTIVPTATQPLNWSNTGDSTDFEATVLGARVSAVITGGPRMNTRGAVPRGTGEIPMFVVGGGGAPLGFENPIETPTKLPSDGFYHAWHAVSVDVDRADLIGQAPVRLASFPILESISIRSFQGRVVPAGTAVELTALARGLPGGWSDPEQALATYMELGSRGLRTCSRPGQGQGLCASRNALLPPLRFFSRTPGIADFALPAGGQGNPFRHPVTKRIVPDPGGRFGLLCTFRPGVAQISAVVGFHEARIALLVRGGEGPCRDGPVADLPAPRPPVVEEVRFAREPVEEFRSRFRPTRAVQAVAIFPPPPAPAVAPAPPGAPGISRKEEHEPSHETEGHGQYRYPATVLARRGADPVPQSWLILGSVAALSFMGAAVAAAARRPRPDWARARASREAWR